MAMTNEELAALVVTLSEKIDTLPTHTDYDALTDLQTNRHTALMQTLAAIESRLTALEEAVLRHIGNSAIHVQA